MSATILLWGGASCPGGAVETRRFPERLGSFGNSALIRAGSGTRLAYYDFRAG